MTDPERLKIAREALVRAAGEVCGDGLDEPDAIEKLERAALAFAAARATDSRPDGPRMTETLARWERAHAELVRELGREPTLKELGSFMSRGITAAHDAVRRLVALGRITRATDDAAAD